MSTFIDGYHELQAGQEGGAISIDGSHREIESIEVEVCSSDGPSRIITVREGETIDDACTKFGEHYQLSASAVNHLVGQLHDRYHLSYQHNSGDPVVKFEKALPTNYFKENEGASDYEDAVSFEVLSTAIGRREIIEEQKELRGTSSRTSYWSAPSSEMSLPFCTAEEGYSFSSTAPAIHSEFENSQFVEQIPEHSKSKSCLDNLLDDSLLQRIEFEVAEDVFNLAKQNSLNLNLLENIAVQNTSPICSSLSTTTSASPYTVPPNALTVFQSMKINDDALGKNILGRNTLGKNILQSDSDSSSRTSLSPLFSSVKPSIENEDIRNNLKPFGSIADEDDSNFEKRSSVSTVSHTIAQQKLSSTRMHTHAQKSENNKIYMREEQEQTRLREIESFKYRCVATGVRTCVRVSECMSIYVYEYVCMCVCEYICVRVRKYAFMSMCT